MMSINPLSQVLYAGKFPETGPDSEPLPKSMAKKAGQLIDGGSFCSAQ